MNKYQRINSISHHTHKKAEVARTYLENKYLKIKHEQQEQRTGWERLNSKMNELNLSIAEQQMIRQEIHKKEAENLKNRRKRITVFDFEPISIIGRGGFGEVRVVRSKITNEILAMKRMNKTEMVHKNQVQTIQAERNVLATANNPWIVELKFSFEDDKSLYLVMEFLQGGDLMNILMKKHVLSEETSRFYIAEIILALESVHKLNYIHRDLKPDNILVDRKGHLKLSDFGLAKESEIEVKSPFKPNRKHNDNFQDNEKHGQYKRDRKLAFSIVGSSNYTAPEVLMNIGYTESADWWSVGTMLFEMLAGYPPFHSENPNLVEERILNWHRSLKFPESIGRDARDLIVRLLCDSRERLNVEEIKRHRFFRSVNWDCLRELEAPWVPDLLHEADTVNFDSFEEAEPFYPTSRGVKRKTKKDLNFIGYTYKKDVANEKSALTKALEELDALESQINEEEGEFIRSEMGVRKILDLIEKFNGKYFGYIENYHKYIKVINSKVKELPQISIKLY